MEPNDATREQLRRDAITRRDDLSGTLRVAYAHMIKKLALEFLEEHRVETVHCYLSFKSEVDTTELIHALLASGIRVVAPISKRDGTMEHHEVTNERVAGLFSVPEPLHTRAVPPSEIDAVVLPVVSFDGSGTRLGYGKGYYDRFLAELDESVPRIGLAYCVQESDLIPRLAHDQPLTVIVTEQGIVRPAG